MKITVLVALAALLTPSGSPDRYGPFRRCVECRNACRSEPDRAACERACFQIKAADCRREGLGPGPARTCDCT